MANNSKVYLPPIVRYPHTLVMASQTTGYQISNFNIPQIWADTEGEGVTIAVLDTGCQVDHPDLIGVTIPDRNYMENNTNIADGDGHGTHVTGIVAAQNNSLGIVGVAPKTKVIVMKVLNDEGWGTVESVALAMHAAVDLNVDVISMSLGMVEPDQMIEAEVQYAYAHNIPIVCAAGNAGDINGLDYPGRYPQTISVGALNIENLRAAFSQTGAGLDFMAPGVDILSTVPINKYARYSGTSMATPWVAGIVALMISKHRKIGGATPVDTVDQVREHLQKVCVDLADPGRDIYTGFGLIDVVSLITSITPEEKDQMEIAVLVDKFNTLVNSYNSLADEEAQLKARLQEIENEKITFTEKLSQISDILG